MDTNESVIKVPIVSIVGDDFWNLFRGHDTTLHIKGYNLFYRSTAHSEWIPATFRWCILRDYYYERGVNTGKHSLELCLDTMYEGKRISYCLWEMNEFDYNNPGAEKI